MYFVLRFLPLLLIFACGSERTRGSSTTGDAGSQRPGDSASEQTALTILGSLRIPPNCEIPTNLETAEYWTNGSVNTQYAPRYEMTLVARQAIDTSHEAVATVEGATVELLDPLSEEPIEFSGPNPFVMLADATIFGSQPAALQLSVIPAL